MAQQISLFIVPTDALKIIFFYSPYSDWTTLSRVCTEWNLFLQLNMDILIWKPIYDEMHLSNVQPSNSTEASPKFHAVVKTFFQKNREDIDFIVKEIKDDQELAKCLHTDSWPLEAFNAKPAIERSRLMWKALHFDATPVLVKLMGDSRSKYSKQLQQLRRQNRNCAEDALEFQKTNRAFPIALSLIEKHKVPYDKSEFVCALLPCFYYNEITKQLLFNIVKSHTDLSKLNQMNFPPIDESPLNPTQTIISLCTIQSSGITTDDLVACKIIHGDAYSLLNALVLGLGRPPT